MGLNDQQWATLIRAILMVVLGPGSYLVLRGILTPEQANQLVPILVPLIMTVGGGLLATLGVKAHSASAMVAAVNSDSAPGVKVVAESSAAPAVSVDAKGLVRPLPKDQQ